MVAFQLSIYLLPPLQFTVIIAQLAGVYLSTEDERLSQPRHCSKGVQPVPKAVYRSCRRDKHNYPR